MATANVFNPPGHLNITSGNISENFKSWKRLFQIYLKASKNDTDDVDGATKVAILLQCAGPDVIKVFDQFNFDTAADKDKLDKVLEKLEAYCSPLKNEVVASHKFWTLDYYTPFDSFLTDLRSLAAESNFGQVTNRLIRDKLVFATKGSLQARLLRETDLSLEKAIQICRVEEMTLAHGKELDKSKSVEKVKVKSVPNQVQQKKKKTDTDKAQTLKYACKFCGYKHAASKSNCPAFGKECKKCGLLNHFAKCCRKKRQVQRVNEETESDVDEEQVWLGAVHKTGSKTVRAQMVVNNCDVTFELDSGAEVNTIKQKYVLQQQVKPTKISLTMWNKSLEKPLGEAKLEVENPKTGRSTLLDFVVVPNNFNCLLGVKSVQEMDLLTINRTNFNLGNISIEQDLGDLGEVHLYTDKSVQPRALPARNIPIALRDKVKAELDSMVSRGIIEPVNQPTEWVSQMAIVEKSNGSLRICIDPQPLNVALQREYFKLPTFDEVLPQFKNAKVFSRVDVQSAFWHVKLDEPSRVLTTMGTPFGRFQWKRLPFGLKVSSEIFQRRLLEALEGLNGLLCVADDIIVIGRGETLTEANMDHDVNLKALQQRCIKRCIKLNDKKSDIKKSSISFMGHVISDKGVSPDPSKVKAVINMPTPTDVESVRRFCGFVQYLSRFLPNLSDDLMPLRQLTHEGVKWDWTEKCSDAVTKVKEKISTHPVLSFYDQNKELVVQVDSSKNGIGAVLLQEGHPVEFASRTMTKSETNYAQIEKECLAVVFGLERFDQYTYGREVTIQNDHKPLSSILKKPLSQSPKRLQSMILRIRRYNTRFQYLEGKKLILADTLSRAALPGEDTKVVHAVNAIKYLNISDSRLEEIVEATKKDESLQTLIKTIKEGWSQKYKDVDDNIKAYFDVKDSLSVYEGLVFKGERIVIPLSMRSLVKERLHSAHLGKDSMLRRARELVYWPGIQKEICQLAQQCKVCLEYKPRNQKETLTQHMPAEQVWEKVGVDLFTIANRDYLVCVDYYSGFWEIDYLPSTSSKAVILKLKGHFSRYGIPKIIMSDNGPQFSAGEFEIFVKEWGIIHQTSSPGYPRSNGRAEAAVKAAKTMMRKAVSSNQDQYLALLEIRNTPVQTHGKSPSQLFFQRRTRTLIPTTKKMLKPTSPHNIRKQQLNRNKAVKKYYDKSAKDLNKLKQGQKILIYDDKRWEHGTVENQIDDHSYQVRAEGNNHLYRRNRIHLREAQPEPINDEPLPVPEIENKTNGDEPNQLEKQIINNEDNNNPRNQRPVRTRKTPHWMENYVSK